MEEKDAIARLKRGDIRGLEALVLRYQAQALRVAYLTTRDYALAEDVVQAAFLRVYERIEQFDSTRPFGPWFLRSVVNGAISAVRGRPVLSLDAPGDHATEFSSPGPGPHEWLEAAETKEEVLAALKQLPPKERAAIVMRYYLEWDDAAVAHKLDAPPGTVRRRLHDARQRLKRLLPT